MKRKAKVVGRKVLGILVMIGGILLMGLGVLTGIFYFIGPGDKAPGSIMGMLVFIMFFGGLLVAAYGTDLFTKKE